MTYKHSLHQCPSWILPVSAFLCSLSCQNMVQTSEVASSLDLAWIALKMGELWVNQDTRAKLYCNNVKNATQRVLE